MHRLGFAAIHNKATGDSANITGGRAMMGGDVAERGVDVEDWFSVGGGLRHDRESGVGHHEDETVRGKGGVGCWAPVENAPVDRASEVDSKPFEGLVVFTMGGLRKLGERGDGISNVGSTEHISVEKFAEKGAVTKTHGNCKGVMLGSAFGRARGRKVGGVKGLGFLVTHGGLGVGGVLLFAGFIPTMTLEHTAKVGFSGEASALSRLEDIVSIERGENALEFERDDVFRRELELTSDVRSDGQGGGFSFAREGEVINLAGKENLVTIHQLPVDVLLVGGVLKAEVEEDGSDVLFPEFAGLRVSLESPEDFDNHAAGELDASAELVPFDKGIVKTHERATGGAGGVGIGIFNVKAEDNEVISCCQGDKETEHGVFQTGSKGVSLLMEPGGTAGGAIAAEASATITVGFDAIVPDITEDDAIKFVVGAEPSGGSKHLHIAKLCVCVCYYSACV